MHFSEKYRPNSFTEIIGQEKAIKKIKEFIQNFLTQKKKAILLHGSPGTGKTSIAIATARENNAEIFELNASDLRNKLNLQEVLKPALKQKSLLFQKKIILVDEVDGISAVDRGGLTELISLIEISPHPIIITANKIWESKFSQLRKKCEIIELEEIKPFQIKEALLLISKKENHEPSQEIINKIAINSSGDLRAAINDLESIIHLNNTNSVQINSRNKKLDIFNALQKIFKELPNNEILSLFDQVDIDLEEITLWIEENIPLEYKEESLIKAIDCLSKADIFKGRIYKQQYWRFLIYQNIFLSFGISCAKRKTTPGFTKYSRPSRILKIWLNNQKLAKQKSITEKYAQKVHIGQKRALQEYPIIKQIIKSNPQIQKELRLEPEEIEYLNK